MKQTRGDKREQSDKNFTHFLSIPVKDSAIIENFVELQKDVLQAQIKGVVP